MQDWVFYTPSSILFSKNGRVVHAGVCMHTHFTHFTWLPTHHAAAYANRWLQSQLSRYFIHIKGDCAPPILKLWFSTARLKLLICESNCTLFFMSRIQSASLVAQECMNGGKSALWGWFEDIPLPPWHCRKKVPQDALHLIVCHSLTKWMQACICISFACLIPDPARKLQKTLSTCWYFSLVWQMSICFACLLMLHNSQTYLRSAQRFLFTNIFFSFWTHSLPSPTLWQ